MKTTEELNAIKAEVISLQKKLAELTDEEISFVTGGICSIVCPHCGSNGPFYLALDDLLPGGGHYVCCKCNYDFYA